MMCIRSCMICIGATILSGCTGLSESINARVERSDARASRIVREVGQVEASARAASPVTHDNGFWVGKTVVKRDLATLPPVFHEEANFDRTLNSLVEFCERITLRSGIPAKVAADVYASAAAPASGGATAGTGRGAGAATAQAGASGAATQAGMPGATGPIRITYLNGSLKGLLDTVAARYGVSWKYADGSIQFFHTETRTFQISAVPGESVLSATVTSGASAGGDSSGSSSGSSGGSSGSGVTSANNQNTAVKSQLSVYAGLEKAIGVMLSPAGKVAASPATGTITVSDTPAALDQVAQYIERENKSLARQVMINVTVLAVTLTQSDSYGINWNLVYQGLSSKYGVSNSMAPSTNSTSFAAAILNTASSKWAGSSLIVDALSEQGQVRRETSASVVTLNNQPVPVQVAKQTSYLKSSQTTLSANVGATTTLTPGLVVSGFNMSILPHILDNGTVLLQFSTDISSLRGIRKVSSNDQSIESPEVDTRNFLQRVAMKSNETLVISGFEQTDDNLNRQGVGHPANFLFGGGKGANTNKEIVVILVTPVSMNSAQSN